MTNSPKRMSDKEFKDWGLRHEAQIARGSQASWAMYGEARRARKWEDVERDRANDLLKDRDESEARCAKLRAALLRVVEEAGKPVDADAERWDQDAHKPGHWLQAALDTGAGSELLGELRALRESEKAALDALEEWADLDPVAMNVAELTRRADRLTLRARDLLKKAGRR